MDGWNVPLSLSLAEFGNRAAQPKTERGKSLTSWSLYGPRLHRNGATRKRHDHMRCLTHSQVDDYVTATTLQNLATILFDSTVPTTLAASSSSSLTLHSWHYVPAADVPTSSQVAG